MYLPKSCTSQGNTNVSPSTTLNVCPLDKNRGEGVAVAAVAPTDAILCRSLCKSETFERRKQNALLKLQAESEFFGKLISDWLQVVSCN